MKFTPLKTAMCISALIHGGVLSSYYAIEHGSNFKSVEPTRERILEIEIVNEPARTAPSITRPLVSQSTVVQKALPSVAPPVQPVALDPALLKGANEFPPLRNVEVEADLPVQPKQKEFETKAVSPFVSGGDVSNPSVEMDVGVSANYLLNPKPVYPVEARKHREEGIVVLAIELSREGVPDRIQLVQSSNFPLLDEAAVNAVKQWRFSPARLGNRAVASKIEVPIRFKLSDSK